MSDNKRLVPTCIIYVDGARLNTACEGAFRSIRIYDTLNRIGECAVDFDYGDLGKENSKTFSFDSELSVHLGYKDDINEVFNGEITGVGISLPESGASRYKVKASSRLQRLNHAKRNRVFENKTPSQAIKDILSRYDLQADCDSFGVEKAHWRSPEQTDMELVLWLARQYGKDVHAFGNKAYVKERMTRKRDEIIYEWGKSLIDFRAVESIKNQPGSVRVIGWDAMKAESFSAKKKISDVSQKVGGGSDWTKLSKSGAQWVHNIYDMDVADSKEAEELALGKLRETGFQFLRAEGSGEGNSKLSAGMEVTVKYVGKAHSGDYIAESVTHDFSLENGYITEFRLKRNMLDDEFVKKASGTGSAAQGGQGRSGGNGNGAGAASQDGSGNAEEDGDEEEEEDGPEFRGLKWKKDGKEVSEALVDDDVTMFFEVKNIDDGETVNVKIWEHDNDGEHDPIKDMTGEVKDGKVEIPWKVEYHADDDDDESNCAEEIEKYGYTVPEYFFVAEYDGVESGDSGQLNVGAFVYCRLYDDETNDILGNTDCILHLPDGSKKSCASDAEGFIRMEKLPHGKTYITLDMEGEQP
jgi:phage protein D